jgi:hypothetical protein
VEAILIEMLIDLKTVPITEPGKQVRFTLGRAALNMDVPASAVQILLGVAMKGRLDH